MYVFDSSSLIQAYRDDFPPSKDNDIFWGWFDNIAKYEGIVVPEKVYEETGKKDDGLKQYITSLLNIQEEPTVNCMAVFKTVVDAYGTLSTEDLERLDAIADPYVIAHSITLKATAVSCEKTAPLRIGLNKKIPDICDSLSVSHESYTRFLWRMRGIYK